MNNNGNPAGLLCVLAVAVLSVALVIVMWWKVWDKTGYGGPMSLLMWIPVVGFFMFLVLVFGDWPVQQEVRRLRRELAERDEYGGGRFGGPPQGFLKREPEGEGETGYRQ